ncbi:hypothetical protein QIA36_05545 (plasmid) [Borreliella yangtzensis]|uniref:hypothetical protein n=1 Tax=Borreliella yangtzensis TaxID=683292 RepID=UPI003BA273D1
MNKKLIMFIFCAIFALIISCDNHGNLKKIEEKNQGKENQKVKKNNQGGDLKGPQVQGFFEKVKGIISTDPTVSKIAEKLKEEEKDKQEKKKEVKVEREENKEELMQGDEPNNINQAQILQANSQDSAPKLETVQQIESGGQQEEEETKEEQLKAKAEAEKEAKEKEEDKRRQQEKEKVKAKIKDLTNKIDKINRDIDSIKHQSWFVEEVERVIVGATEVRDKVTGPILDYFTNAKSNNNQAIYYTWNLEDEYKDEDEDELKKLLENLEKTRTGLRNKLNEGDTNTYYSLADLKLKENVKVSEIASDLQELKSKLEEVKNYLETQSNFETIKGYISDSVDY